MKVLRIPMTLLCLGLTTTSLACGRAAGNSGSADGSTLSTPSSPLLSPPVSQQPPAQPLESAAEESVLTTVAVTTTTTDEPLVWSEVKVTPIEVAQEMLPSLGRSGLVDSPLSLVAPDGVEIRGASGLATSESSVGNDFCLVSSREVELRRICANFDDINGLLVFVSPGDDSTTSYAYVLADRSVEVVALSCTEVYTAESMETRLTGCAVPSGTEEADFGLRFGSDAIKISLPLGLGVPKSN